MVSGSVAMGFVQGGPWEEDWRWATVVSGKYEMRERPVLKR